MKDLAAILGMAKGAKGSVCCLFRVELKRDEVSATFLDHPDELDARACDALQGAAIVHQEVVLPVRADRVLEDGLHRLEEQLAIVHVDLLKLGRSEERALQGDMACTGHEPREHAGGEEGAHRLGGVQVSACVSKVRQGEQTVY